MVSKYRSDGKGSGTASIFHSEIPAPRIGAHPSNPNHTIPLALFKRVEHI